VEKIVYSDSSEKVYKRYEYEPTKPKTSATIIAGTIVAGFLGALLIVAGTGYFLLLSIF
jgi:hypothetical protein